MKNSIAPTSVRSSDESYVKPLNSTHSKSRSSRRHLPRLTTLLLSSLVLSGLLLSGCASRGETQLMTVEQVKAQRASMALEKAEKEQKTAAKKAVAAKKKADASRRKQTQMAAKQQAEQERQIEKMAKAARTQSQPRVKTAKSSNGGLQKKSRTATAVAKLKSSTQSLRSMVGKVWPFGKPKPKRSTKSTYSAGASSKATNSGTKKPSVKIAQSGNSSAPVASLPTTITHPDGNTNYDNGLGLEGKTIELVGVLSVVKSETCGLAAGCGPEYSLLAPDMTTRVYALTGNIGEELHGRLVAVKGLVTALPAELASTSGYRGIAEVLDVAQYVAVSDYAYYPFVSQAASEYSQSEYGCNLLWDKTYSWYLDGKQPRYTVRLTNTRSLNKPKPYLELAYDGKNRGLVSIALVPHEVNPCEL